MCCFEHPLAVSRIDASELAELGEGRIPLVLGRQGLPIKETRTLTFLILMSAIL